MVGLLSSKGDVVRKLLGCPLGDRRLLRNSVRFCPPCFIWSGTQLLCEANHQELVQTDFIVLPKLIRMVANRSLTPRDALIESPQRQVIGKSPAAYAKPTLPFLLISLYLVTVPICQHCNYHLWHLSKVCYPQSNAVNLLEGIRQSSVEVPVIVFASPDAEHALSNRSKSIYLGAFEYTCCSRELKCGSGQGHLVLGRRASPLNNMEIRHAVPLWDNQDVPGDYRPCFIKSLTCSPITIVVTLVFARIQSGIMEASTTLNPVRPCTLPYWSTTAIGSDGDPILQVQEMC